MWSMWKASGSSSVRVTMRTAGKKREDEYGENFLLWMIGNGLNCFEFSRDVAAPSERSRRALGYV